MKVSKIILYVLLIVSLLLPYIAIGQAADKPEYVGFNEDQEFVWKTEFDKDPLEDYIEDDITSDEELIDILADSVFYELQFDEDIVSWKVVVSDIDDEDEKDYNGALDDENDVKYVKIQIDIYEKEEGEDWEDLDKNEKFKIWESEEIVYSDFLLASFKSQDIPYIIGSASFTWFATLGMGLYFYTINKDDPIENDPFDWNVSAEWPMFFIPRNLDYDDVVDDCDEWIEDKGYIAQYEGNLENYVSVGTSDVDYFFQSKEVGLKTNIEFTGNVEEFDSEIKFTDDGVMYYYEWSYDGDTIAKFELSSMDQSLVYIIENWWWIALIVGAVVVVVIVIIVILIKKRK